VIATGSKRHIRVIRRFPATDKSVPIADGHDLEDLTFAATGWGAEAVSQIAGSFSEAAVEPPSSLPPLFLILIVSWGGSAQPCALGLGIMAIDR